MNILPAMDIMNAQCVRLTQGKFDSKKMYSDNPVEMAKTFENAGLQNLHLVDLDGAKTGSIKNLEVLQQIAAATKLKIDFGGGLANVETIETVLKSGASAVNIGSMAVKKPEVFNEALQQFGGGRVWLSADVLDEKIQTAGWQTGSEIELFPFIEQWMAKGVQTVVCTDISKDGMLIGAANELYIRIKKVFPELFLIASGGVAQMSNLTDLNALNMDACIVGKAYYEGHISLEQLASF